MTIVTHEFGIPGYIPEEEHRHKLENEAREAQLELDAKRNAVIEELAAKFRLAETSTAPKDCVVEFMGEKGVFFPRIQVIASYPAWYLGGWDATYKGWSSGYVPSVHHYFAIAAGGRLLHNDRGIGERKEFRIGLTPGTTIERGLVKDIYQEMGHTVRKIPDDIEYMINLAGLPGWNNLGDGG